MTLTIVYERLISMTNGVVGGIALTFVPFLVTSVATVPLIARLICKKSSQLVGNALFCSFLYHVLHIMGILLTWFFLFCVLVIATLGGGPLSGPKRPGATLFAYFQTSLLPLYDDYYVILGDFGTQFRGLVGSYLSFICVCYLVCRVLSTPIVKTLDLPKPETTQLARKLVLIVIIPHAIIASFALALIAFEKSYP